jgi:hypothetical protein
MLRIEEELGANALFKCDLSFFFETFLELLPGITTRKKEERIIYAGDKI